MELPNFRYFPDPLGEGIIKISNNCCMVCNQHRGYIYTGHVYASREYSDCICLWCIADGSAHHTLDVSFSDDVYVGGGGRWEMVAQTIIDEIVYRTPSFNGWQQEMWFTHCGDAAAFLGRVGYSELVNMGQNAIEAIRESTSLVDDEWKQFFRLLDKNDSPRVYLFQCLHCGKYGGYTDSD